MTSLLDTLAAKHQAEFDAQRAHMRTPEFLARIALMQQVADTLAADGFAVWPQICWPVASTPDEYPPGIHLHIEINRAHEDAGRRRISELLPDFVPGKKEYVVDGAAIELHAHADRIDGWKPAALREAA